MRAEKPNHAMTSGMRLQLARVPKACRVGVGEHGLAVKALLDLLDPTAKATLVFPPVTCATAKQSAHHL